MILFLSCFLTGFFVFTSYSIAEEKSIIISAVKIQSEGTGNSNDDFIELYNTTCTDINISGWKLRKKINSGTESSIKVIGSGKAIPAKGYFLWTHSNLAETLSADQSTGATLSNNYSLALFNKTGTQIDSLTWGSNSNPFSPTISILNPNPVYYVIRRDESDNISYEKNYIPKNSTVIETVELDACPKEPDPPPEEEPKIYSNNITLNEIFPNPPKGQEEFIELYNPEEKDNNLSGWILRDGSKTGKYIFPENSSIKSQDYLVVYKENFKFALNNSGVESVTLSSPDEKIVSTVSYTGAKKNISYNFNGQTWRWSKFLTPGAENIFNNLPQVKDDVPKKAYKNMFVEFSAKGSDKDNDKLKYTWDFGDKHKSYLQKTRHKYAKTGQYTVTLKISDGSEDIIKSFEVKVEKFPNLDVNIIGLSANPSGVDTGNEWIKIKNKSKKKINLKDWSIATGDKKKLVNHPIASDLVIKSGKELILTHANSKFTLNNAASKIELRYPTGKVASKAAYKSPAKSVPDDAIYEKIKGGWTWKFPIVQPALPLEASMEVSIHQPPAKSAQQLAQELEIKNSLGKSSPSPEWNNKKQARFSLLNFGLHIQTASAFSEKSPNLIKDYFSSQEFPSRKHWIITLLQNINIKITCYLNSTFLKFVP